MKKQYESEHNKDKKDWLVYLDLEGSVELEIEADSKEEAEKLALEEWENMSKYDKCQEIEVSVWKSELVD